MKQDGVEVKPIITLGGSHTRQHGAFLTDVKVPVENRVGEEGKGWTYAKGLLQHERTGLAGISRSLVALEKLKEQADAACHPRQCHADGRTRLPSQVAELEVDLLAAEYTELRLAGQRLRRQRSGAQSPRS